MLKMQRK
ncbi:hypothetical protein FOXB_04431 [Fusarium oxysporum f. sp. conglutinans Fo5176]|nr:hypothetical protein FOXB_04431 [Fusarium oxysporum f. sp. conglutinans Fo5176]